MNKNIFNDPSAIANLVKNPLGIIALFILLVYGILSLLIGSVAFSCEDKRIFDKEQIDIIVYFLVGFPLIVLAIFYWLVTRHHQKLYSPQDYKNDDTFLKTIPIFKATNEEVRKKYEEEQVIQNAIVQVTGAEMKISVGDVNTTTKDTYLPTPMDLLTPIDVMGLEEKAIQQLEKEYSIKFDRNIKLEYENNDFILDAGYLDTDTMQFVIAEIRMLKSSFAVEIISRLLLRFIQLQQQLNRVEIKLIIGVLCDEDKSILDSKIQKLVKGLPIKVQLEYFDISALKEERNG